MGWAPNEPDIETLTREALDLLSLEMDELHTLLGCQLLASGPPGRIAAILARVRELRNANRPRRDNGPLTSEMLLDEWMSSVDEICRDLRSDSGNFIETMRQQFKASLCNKDIIDLASNVDASKMQILIMLISAIMKLPSQFESICATLAAMCCKSLLKEVCQ
jgi:hypothetical protein